LITPGSAGYREAALRDGNLFQGFGKLALANGETRTNEVHCFQNAEMLAPFATVAQTGETWFSFKAANSDGLNHFRTLGAGSIGLEDIRGGYDMDFDDLAVSFRFRIETRLNLTLN
jgi:hypothetical protein